MTMPAFRRRPRPQIFISFQGNDLRKGFVSHVVKALKDARVNVFVDSDDQWERRRPHHHDHLFRRIHNSKLALVIFSDKYAESQQCLNELMKIHESMTEGKLMVIPIFYKVNIEEVNNLEGRFGKCFDETVMRIHRRQNDQLTDHILGCLRSIARKPGFTSGYYSNDSDLVEAIIQGIKKKIPYIPAKLTIGEEVSAELLSASVVAALCFYFTPISVFPDLGFFISPRWYLAVLLLFVVRHSLRLIQS